MAGPNTTRGVRLLIKVEDTKGSGTWSTLCTVSAERGITFTNALTEQVIPDCTDLEQIASISREKASHSVAATGGGLVHKQDLKRLEVIRLEPDSWSCKIIVDDDDAANIITYTGNFHLGEFAMTGNRGNKVEGTMSFASDGPVAATFGANVD